MIQHERRPSLPPPSDTSAVVIRKLHVGLNDTFPRLAPSQMEVSGSDAAAAAGSRPPPLQLSGCESCERGAEGIKRFQMNYSEGLAKCRFHPPASFWAARRLWNRRGLSVTDNVSARGEWGRPRGGQRRPTGVSLPTGLFNDDNEKNSAAIARKTPEEEEEEEEASPPLQRHFILLDST